MDKTIQEALEQQQRTMLEVKRGLDDVKYKVSELTAEIKWVTIINGNDTEIKIKRRDFDQANYNKPDRKRVDEMIEKMFETYPGKKISKLAEMAKNLTVILGFIGLIITILKTSGLI